MEPVVDVFDPGEAVDVLLGHAFLAVAGYGPFERHFPAFDPDVDAAGVDVAMADASEAVRRSPTSALKIRSASAVSKPGRKASREPCTFADSGGSLAFSPRWLF